MTGKKLKFLQYLLEESTVSKAAEKAGISRQTAYNYLKDPDFCTELNQRRTDCINDAIRYLQGKLSLCNEALVKIVENPDASDQIKINAVNSIYANCKSMTETAEMIALSERAERMEQWIKEQEEGA